MTALGKLRLVRTLLLAGVVLGYGGGVFSLVHAHKHRERTCFHHRGDSGPSHRDRHERPARGHHRQPDAPAAPSADLPR